MTDDAAMASGLHQRFEDADDFTAALRAAEVDYLPLAAGRYQARLTVMRVGPFTIQHAHDAAHISRGGMAADRGGLIMAASAPHAIAMNGEDVTPATASLQMPGSDLHALCRQRLAWMAVSAPAAEVEALLDHWAMAGPRRGASAMLAFAPDRIARLRGTLVAMTALVGEAPWWETAAAPARAMAEEIHDALRHAVPGPAPAPSGRERATRGYLRIVAGAEEFMRAAVDRPFYTRELCAALGVTERKLHGAFVAVCGMSPQAYLRRRRLGMVRRALKAAEPGAMLVKSVALAHGFWHLGKFAQEYAAQYGERPSQTLAAPPVRPAPPPAGG